MEEVIILRIPKDEVTKFWLIEETKKKTKKKPKKNGRRK